MTEAETPYLFRPYIETDIPFIQSSWANSYYKGSNYHRLLSPKEFHFFHRPIRESYLRRPTAAVIVCADKRDDTILAWIAVEKLETQSGLILHYLYVKEAFKKDFNLARELIERALPERPVMFTHLTEQAAKMLAKPRDLTDDFFFTPHLV